MKTRRIKKPKTPEGSPKIGHQGVQTVHRGLSGDLLKFCIYQHQEKQHRQQRYQQQQQESMSSFELLHR